MMMARPGIALAASTALGWLCAIPAAAQTGYASGLDPEIYCSLPESERIDHVAGGLRNAWYDLDVHGRAVIGRLDRNGAGDERGSGPESHSFRARAEDYRLDLQRLVVLAGALLPQYNRPLDGPRLILRLETRSVPAFATAAEHKVAVMEAFLVADENNDNRDIGSRFVNLLGEAEGSAAAAARGDAAPEFPDQRKALRAAFQAFMPTLRSVVFSPSLERALARRLSSYCREISVAEGGSQ
jgi:hypothetical protein